MRKNNNSIHIFTVFALRQCRSARAVCVPVKFCPPIFNAIIANNTQQNYTLKKDIWSRACHQRGENPHVCCEPADIAIDKHCVNSRGLSGRCVAPEHCRLIPDVRKSRAVKKRQENLCYQEGNKEYFCCSEESLVNTPTKKRRTRANKQLMAIENEFASCKDATGKSGLCVPVRHCDRIYGAFLDGRIYEDTHLADFVRRSNCPSDARPSSSICCATSSARSGLDYIRHKNAVKLGLGRCGVVRIVDKILKGGETAPGQYPWMANLLYKQKNTMKTYCSGSLINPKYVLTAAHCIRGKTIPKAIQLGVHDISNIQHCTDSTCAGPGQIHAIEKIIRNENFNGFSSEYDIALIRLATEATLVPDQVYPICLPITRTLLMLKPKQLVVLGWGVTERQKPSNVLLEAELEVTNRTKLCIDEATFCARGKSREGHCAGDSGGPYQAMIPAGRNYKYVQFGVISGGAGQCSVDNHEPGVGVFVGYHVNWILDNLEI
ncbi:CLIP domain-containing serine protease HP8-like [Sabethes cyaneus]|uniref:CLIP domain-containing serine protease HP8-like n=1 Tax=Sabethes cyaneus TaxID=53552 RepID=UPI00237E7430|nr:CLIP domain-containing serine protease HP8-like [Sabethes cyaneus]